MEKYRLRACREERGYTQAEIAKVLGITRSAYTHYESGRNDIPLDSLMVLADFYKCTTDELLGSRYWFEHGGRK